jgi:hypothetical protein
MSRHTDDGQYSPEFREWLKEKRVPRRLRNDPEVLRQHYQEWRKGQPASRKRSLFRLPNLNLDFGTIINQVRTVSELLETLQHTRNLIRSPRSEKDEIQ